MATGTTVGVRWYELTSPTSHPGQFSVYQQATYSPDSTYRWMGSIAMDKLGDMALGYSASSSSLYPEIVATGRTPGDTLGTMRTEFVLQSGGGSQVGQSRWGDYTAMRIDPADDCTFWYTNQYYQQNSDSAWSTSINPFKINSNCTGSTSYNLSLSVFGSRGGTITGSPSGISCPATCSASYASGTQVTLTATTADGNWHFAGWGGACSGTGTCTVTMNANQSVTAAFLIADQFLVFPGLPDAGSAPQPPPPVFPGPSPQ